VKKRWEPVASEIEKLMTSSSTTSSKSPSQSPSVQNIEVEIHPIHFQVAMMQMMMMIRRMIMSGSILHDD
jgi:hypothetical protein